jgi:uncharacterized protein YndB with AHSA1/START domain
MAREVHSGSRDGKPTKVVVARRTYPTDQADLWDALTNIERIPRWFLPVTGELKLGGRYQLEGNAGGVVERCDRPQSFAATWEFGGDVTWLEVTLTPAASGTTFELRHEAHVPPELWAQYGPTAVGLGWDLGLMALGLHIESGEAVDREAGMVFSFTPVGKEFVRTAGDDWASAAIADGDDAEAARQAAETGIAAYTTMPEEAPQAE